MFKRMDTDTMNWIIIIGVILFVAEVTFFDSGLIFSFVFFGLMTYVGWKRYARSWGKVVFWVGLVILILTIINTMAVRFLVLVFGIMLLVYYSRSKSQPSRTEPSFTEEPFMEELYEVEPLFRHKLFGDEKTSDTAYEWRDIHIHGGIGDRVIDLSNTVLPKGVSVISIRQMVGNIVIHVPYDMEVSIHHSAVLGRSEILGKHHTKLLGQQVAYQTEGYGVAASRVTITTSLISGNLEVKRI
ncbi:cell wall-active antibiotics response protein LiaF [Thalassobacillus hwangdonensis]|uniref:Cell wall-active antibiotics response protein LiaF n=1 Tax=Thalassobacillus hwangdonensis TaxID=546108 RepID=A0ABW3L5U4_9BACI